MKVSRYLRRRLPIVFTWSNVARVLDLQPSIVESVRPTILGSEVVLRLGPPLNAARVTTCAAQIAVAYGVARVRVIQDAHEADLVRVLFDSQLSIGDVMYPIDQREVWIPSDPSSPMPIGLDDDGEPILISLIGRSALLGGSPGSGKSNGLRVCLAGLASRRHVSLFGIDPKRAELSLWRGRFSGLVLGHEPEPVIELLTELLDEIHVRAEYLASVGSLVLLPSSDHPAIVLIVDEWAEVGAAGSAKSRQQIDALLKRFVSLGRAVGCSAVLATQRPTSDTIDVGTRSLLEHRFALRCGDRYQADAILGVGTYEPTQLLSATPGRALWSNGGPACAIQFYSVPDYLVPELASPGLRVRPVVRQIDACTSGT
jgi:S-DNA-T family DNA segregation ATPase FtsK/SpoIIIE